MKDIRLLGTDDQKAVLPKFTTNVARTALDDIETDLVLLPMLSGMNVPASLHAEDPELAELIKSSIRDSGFEGKRGTHLVIERPQEGKRSRRKRFVLLVGLGRPDCFNATVAREVFEQLTEQAVRLGVTRVAVPFISNRMTRMCLNFKGMAHLLKQAVAQGIHQADGNVALREVQLLCSTQARRYIQQGLDCPVEFPDAPDVGCCE